MHSSWGDWPYFGIHLTFTSIPCIPKLLLFISAHCCSRKSSVSAGQSWMLQERYLILVPIQYFPPFAGAGESHSRVDDWTPPPHDLLHSSNLKKKETKNFVESNWKMIFYAKCYCFHDPHLPSILVNACLFRGTHFPCWHQWLEAHSVPSAQGICCVLQPSLSLPHHNLTHGGYKYIIKRNNITFSGFHTENIYFSC